MSGLSASEDGSDRVLCPSTFARFQACYRIRLVSSRVEINCQLRRQWRRRWSVRSEQVLRRKHVHAVTFLGHALEKMKLSVIPLRSPQLLMNSLTAEVTVTSRCIGTETVANLRNEPAAGNDNLPSTDPRTKEAAPFANIHLDLSIRHLHRCIWQSNEIPCKRFIERIPGRSAYLRTRASSGPGRFRPRYHLTGCLSVRYDVTWQIERWI